MSKLGRIATPRHRTWLILGLFLLLAFSYTLAIPLGEAYDEWAHFAYIRYVATERRLPASGQRLVPEITWDATHHPPLYYVLGALVTAPIDMSDNLRPNPNPHLPNGYNLNAYIHGPEERWPWKGSVLGMHVARGVSIAMGGVIVWLTLNIARLLEPQASYKAWAAMAIAACMPQFVFTSSIITNDIAITLCATWALYLLVRIYQSPSLKYLGLLCVAIVGALMSKANGIALIPASVCLLGMVLVRRWETTPQSQRIGILLGGALLIGSSLFVLFRWETWNTYLQGHHSSVSGAITNYILPALLRRPNRSPFAWHLLPSGLAYTYHTFWAAFGMGNVPVDAPFYIAMSLINALALVGVILWARKAERTARQRLGILLLYAFWMLVPPVFLILSSHVREVSPGRYLMALMPVVAILQAWGLAELGPRRRPYLLAGYMVALLLFSAIVPWRYLRPTYAPPRRLTQAQVQEIAQPLTFRFGDAIALIGYRFGQTTAKPGDTVDIYLYWQCLAPIPTDYTVSVQLLDPSYTFYGGADAYPGRGNHPTSLWQPGEIIEDHHRITIGQDFPPPAYAIVKVEVYEYETYRFLPLTIPAGGNDSHAALFGRLRVVSPTHKPYPRPQQPLALYGGAIALTDCAPDPTALSDGMLPVTLRWYALEHIEYDYTVFLQLLDPDGNIVAQADGQPLNGRFPTSLWRPGDSLEETRLLALGANPPSGTYRIAVGFYRLETMERLPATDAQGTPLPAAQFMLPVEVRVPPS